MSVWWRLHFSMYRYHIFPRYRCSARACRENTISGTIAKHTRTHAHAHASPNTQHTDNAQHRKLTTKSVHVKQVFRWGSAGVPRGFRWGSSGVPRVHRGFRCVFACVRPTFQGVPSEGTAGFYNIKKEQTGSWGQGVYERAALF